MRHYWAGCVTLFICNEIRAFVVHDLLEFSCMAAVSPIPDNDRTNMLLPDCFPVTFPLMAWRLMSAATASIATFSPPGNSIDENGEFSAEVRKSEAVALGEPVMPVFDGLGG